MERFCYNVALIQLCMTLELSDPDPRLLLPHKLFDQLLQMGIALEEHSVDRGLIVSAEITDSAVLVWHLEKPEVKPDSPRIIGRSHFSPFAGNPCLVCDWRTSMTQLDLVPTAMNSNWNRWSSGPSLAWLDCDYRLAAQMASLA